MDPLSALRMMATPQLQGRAGMAGAQEATRGGIPTKELESLLSNAPGKAQAFVDSGKTPAGLAPQVLGTSSSGALGNLATDFVREVSHKQNAAGDAVHGLLNGQNVSLHQAMISMEEASLSFQMMVEVRNKLLESYQELMRMQM